VRLPVWVEAPVLALLEEVDLAVAAPHEGDLQMGRDAGKTLTASTKFWPSLK